MESTHKDLKKLKLTTRMAYMSLGILILALLLNEFREPLLGIKKGYASHNFGFNFTFFLPSLIIAFGLGLTVIVRTIKYWKDWINLNKKIILIGMSIPAIGIWIYFIVRVLI